METVSLMPQRHTLDLSRSIGAKKLTITELKQTVHKLARTMTTRTSGQHIHTTSNTYRGTECESTLPCPPP